MVRFCGVLAQIRSAFLTAPDRKKTRVTREFLKTECLCVLCLTLLEKANLFSTDMTKNVNAFEWGYLVLFQLWF